MQFVDCDPIKMILSSSIDC